MILFSILTPAVPSRFKQAEALSEKLSSQIGSLPIEHLILTDNKRRTVGEKRDALLRAARGEYVAFVDDDDDVSNDYVQSIVAAIQSSPDVITFHQHAIVNGISSEIIFGLGNENQAFQPEAQTMRAAWHVCAWRRTLAVCSRFPASNYGEDWAFAEPLNKIAKTSRHIPRILHFYIHSSVTTEAPPPAI